MQTRSRDNFTTIHTEGALLPADLLQRISENDSSPEGLDAASYHLAPGERINEAINRSWNRLNGLRGAFQAARVRLGAGDAGTSLTRERWLLPLFQELGYGRLSTAKAIELEGKTYPISHCWENVPLHLIGCSLQLDKRVPASAWMVHSMSASAMVLVATFLALPEARISGSVPVEARYSLKLSEELPALRVRIFMG